MTGAQAAALKRAADAFPRELPIQKDTGLSLQTAGFGSLMYVWYSSDKFTFAVNEAGMSAAAQLRP